MMGPNTLSGHLSVIYTVECQIDFTMRVIAPILTSLKPRNFWLPWSSNPVDRVVVTPEAEARDIEWTQREAKKMVWASGCTSWAVDEKNGRNTAMYPDWQYNFWWRSVFIPRKDFQYSASPAISNAAEEKINGNDVVGSFVKASALGVAVIGALALLQSSKLDVWFEYARQSLVVMA